MILTVFILFIIAIYYLGFKGYQKVNTAEDLIVANWDLPLPLVTWSLIAALLAAPFYFASVSSGYFQGGWEAFATMGGLASCMILGAFIWVKPLRRLKGWTIGDYYGLRFADKKLGAYAGGIMAVAFGFFNAGALTVGGAYIIQTILNVPFWAAAVIFVVLSLVYTMMGGLWSLAYADILNGIVSVLGILAITVVIFMTSQGSIFNPDWWDVSKLFSKGGADFWILYLVLALGDIPAADLGQRVCGAKNPKVASKSMIIAGVVIMALAWTPGMIGEAFKTIFPGVENAEPLTLIYATKYWHPLFAGLFLSAMVGMAMSTLAACFMASAGIFAKNIYLDFINHNPLPDKLLMITRIAILVSGILALTLSLAFAEVLSLAYLAWDIVFVTIFWPLVVPPFWKGVSGKAVWVSITGGIICYILTNIYGVPGPESGGLLLTLYKVPVFFSVIVSGLLLLVVSLISPPNEATLAAHQIEITPTEDEITLKKDNNIATT